jgi:signal transduction histidine kinase
MDERQVTSSDVLLAAALVAIMAFGTGPAAENQNATAPVLAHVLAVAACLPVVVWRWRPTAAAVVTSVAALTYIGLGYPYGPVFLAFALVLFGSAARTPLRWTGYLTAAVLVASVVVQAPGLVAGDRDWRDVVVVSAWVLVPVSIGGALRTRRDATAAVRRQHALRAASEERVHLAQEVHDVVGHGLAVIAMHAGVALRVLDRDPARVRESLEAIRTVSTEALDGLRAELAALRDPAATAALRPAGGLADLPALVERIRGSGLAVRADLCDPDDVPAEVGTAAYRIVQESLTNVLRHGGPDAAARVLVAYDGAALRVEVRDTGHTPPGPHAPAGQGIAGMRARARALGGTLTAGPDPGGGFVVRADLPAGADGAGA